MSITNGNPSFINIIPVFNAPNGTSGIDSTTALRNDVNNIQEMVNYDTKTIKTDFIGSFNKSIITFLNPAIIPSIGPPPIDGLLQNSCTSAAEAAAAAAAGNNNNGSGCCSNVDRLDSNSYGWYFPVSSIGGTGIVDATHVPRSSADTYTNAITKLDYWIYENLVDTPPAPTYLAENNSFSSINFYWANPQQFKLNFLTQTWAPYMSSITIHLYSNVQPHSSNLWLTYTYGNQYVPHGLSGSTPLVGVEFMNNLGNGSISTYSNSTYSNYILQVQLANTLLTNSNGPFSIDVSFQNYSINSNRYLVFHSNTVASCTPRAPTTADFYLTLYNNGGLGVYVVPTLYPWACMIPSPVFYYVLQNTTVLNPQTLTGTYTSGTHLPISVIGANCGFNQYFNFVVSASNIYGSATLTQAANTGPAPFAATPTVSLAGSTINSNTGVANIVYSVGNAAPSGTLYWSFTTPSQAMGNSGTGVRAASFALTPTHFFQYYDNTFTLLASNVQFCTQTSTNFTTYNSAYTVSAPQMYVSVTTTDSNNEPPYNIIATLSNIPTVPSGVTLSTTWSNLNGINATINSTTSSNLTAIGSNINVFRFSAYYTFTDSSNVTRRSLSTIGQGSAGAILHAFSGPINQTQQIQETYPADAIVNTCYASVTTGFSVTGTPGPGATILFITNGSPGITDGTYFWGYQNNTP